MAEKPHPPHRQAWHLPSAGASQEGPATTSAEALKGVRWFRQLSVRVQKGHRIVHVDPNGIPDSEPPAQFILLTHPHYDVFSEADIETVRTTDTVVVAPASMKKLVPNGDHYLRPGDMVQVDGVEILAIPAYNQDRRYHPREAAWLGYLFNLDGVVFYHAGHSGIIPVMNEIRCDVAFFPCDGKYSMNPEEVARAAGITGASVVVPLHWEGIRDREAWLARLRDAAPCHVAVLEPASPRIRAH